MTEWKTYRKTAVQPMRPYVPGEDLSEVSVVEAVSEGDTPGLGGMIARNPKDHDDQWYVSATFFANNYEEAQ